MTAICQEYGFVDKVVEDAAELEAETQHVCDRITLCAPGAIAAQLHVSNSSMFVSIVEIARFIIIIIP